MGKTERVLMLVFTIIAGLSGTICAYIAVATYHGGRELKVTPSIVSNWPSIGWGVVALAFWCGSVYLIFHGTKKGMWPFFKKKDNSFIPLREVVEKLREEGLKQTTYGYSLDSIFKMQNPDEEYDRLAIMIVKYVDIYGKQTSSSLGNWVKISEDIIFQSDFRKLASELHLKNYINRGPEFVDLAINKNDLEKAIDDVILYENTPLYQG